MRGELSEVFGDVTLETDKLLRALGVMRAAQAQLAGLPAEVNAALQAYSEGINAFHASTAQALQPEFQLLGVKPGLWTPADSVGWSVMMALDLGGNWGNEFARLSAARVLDTDRLWQLFPPYAGERPAATADVARLYAALDIYRRDPAPTTRTGAAEGTASPAPEGLRESVRAGLTGDMARWSAEFVAGAGTVEGKGSNNWVVAGSRTVSGKPLLANDPHLGLSAPAIWYFARLQAPASQAADGSVVPGLDVIGATLPGLPAVVLGRTATAAWGFTNTGPDVQDLYLEQINPANPAQYRTPDGWADFRVRTEVFRVKGQPDLTLSLRETRHGPVLSDVQKSHGELLDTRRYVLALRWSGLDADNRTLLAALRANRAGSVPDLVAAFADHHSPMQSVVMADVQGRVAFKAVGKAPLRRSDNDIRGVAPSPGWDARYDWTGWIPYDQTPQDDPAETARRGWHATANQRIAAPDYPHFLGQDWHEPYRFDRIAQLLSATPRHDVASMQAVQGDVLSLASRRLLPWLRQTASGHPLAAAAHEQLRDFDGDMRADRAAPLIFAAWVDELTRGVLGARLGEDRFLALYGKRHFRSAIEGVMERQDAWWCAPKSCAGQSTDALGRALDRLQAQLGSDVTRWQWGALHPALSTHRPFGNVALLARFFDVRVPSGGDNFSINVGQYWPNDAKQPFANRHAASLRAIYDLADLEQSRFIYQTGQSGLVFSDRYRDMRDEWAAVQYRPLQLRPAAFRHALTLRP
jgi:penicillin amidase